MACLNCSKGSTVFWRAPSPSTFKRSRPAIHAYAESKSLSMGNVVNPLRVATTGQGVGPGLYDCLVILGRDECRARIAGTLDMLATLG